MSDDVRILLVDDEESILNILKITLQKEDFTHIYTATNGKDAILLCRQKSPDLIVLDIMLPDQSGLSLCNDLRRVTDAPIFFLSARNSDIDKLTGFDLGGDDYITKPFNPLEVVARIKARLRRNSKLDPSVENINYNFGLFQVFVKSGQLIVNDKEIFCPAKELQLLIFLCQHPNNIFSKKQLYELVWGEESFGDDTTVAVHIRRLREKIEPDPSNPQFLITHRGLGYKLVYPKEMENSR